MKNFIKTAVYLLITAAIFIAHYSLLNIFFFTSAEYHLILSAIVLTTAFIRKDVLLWLIIPLAFFMETFSSAPFGFICLALLLSTATIHWLLNIIFTNRSIPIIALTTAAGICIYRICFDFLIFANWFLRDQSSVFSFGTAFFDMGMELLITVFFTVVFYVIISMITRILFPRKALIFEAQSNSYGQKKYF
ncbi:hypothetical protein KKA13_01925 [Patescibacteria group bacterium]|nr:hypothetical protein [Patescibacteria group bacterium]MBU1613203.1 hypothetical protein [Patescibacteria group bacterium]